MSYVDDALATLTARDAHPAEVEAFRRRLEQLAERTGADELLSTASTHDRAALAGSDASLAALLA